MLGAPIATFVAPQYLADTMRSLRDVISGGPASMAIPSRLLRSDKATLPRVLTAMRVTGGEASGMLVVVIHQEDGPMRPSPPSSSQEFPFGWRYVKRVQPDGGETVAHCAQTKLEPVLRPTNTAPLLG